MRSNLAYTYIELGAHREAEGPSRIACAHAEQLGLPMVVGGARHNLGWALTLLGAYQEAREQLEQAIILATETCDSRLFGTSNIYMSRLLVKIGDRDAAEKHARLALEALSQMPPVKAYALAVLADLSLQAGRNAEAVNMAREAWTLIEDVSVVEEGDAFVRLTFAKAVDAFGERDVAARVIRSSRELVMSRAAKIANAAWAKSFLTRVPENRDILRFAAELIGDEGKSYEGGVDPRATVS